MAKNFKPIAVFHAENEDALEVLKAHVHPTYRSWKVSSAAMTPTKEDSVKTCPASEVLLCENGKVLYAEAVIKDGKYYSNSRCSKKDWEEKYMAFFNKADNYYVTIVMLMRA